MGDGAAAVAERLEYPGAPQPARYNPRDRTHAQIDPEAFEIVQRNGWGVTPGRRDDKTPAFRGMPEEWWRTLLARSPADFARLLAICMSDFPTCCALLLYVVSRMSGEVHPFIWNNGQLILWNRMSQRIARGQPLFFVVLKARQLGITTFVAAWHFFNLWKASDVHTLNVAHDVKLAERIVGFFRVFYDHLPAVGGIKPKLRQENKHASIPKSELYFADSRSHGETHVAKNLDPRGNTSRHIGESEAAFYPDLESFNDALMPQLPSVGSPARAKCSVIIESTPNGQNAFYDYWEECKEPNSEFWGLFLPWYVQDDEYIAEAPATWRMTLEERELQTALSLMRKKIDGKTVSREQMYWRHLTLQNKPFSGNEEAFDEAYPSDDETCFMLRSESVFHDSMPWLSMCVQQANVRARDAWALRMDTKGNAIETSGPVRGELLFEPLHSPFSGQFFRKLEKPRFAMRDNGHLWVWEPPVAGHVYFAAADTAAGELGRDESVCAVVDVTTGHQVAEFGSNDHKPEDFADILVHLCLWYNHAMILPELNGLGSVVMKRMTNEWGYTNIAHEEKWDEMGVKKNKPGFVTGPLNRPMIFSALRWMVEEKYLVISSKKLLKQMSTFKRDGMDYRTAKKNQHDDYVVAMGLLCLGVRQSPKAMMALHDAARRRVPSAVDLGLNRQPSPVPAIRGVKDEMAEKLLGLNGWTMPLNPLRGPLDF